MKRLIMLGLVGLLVGCSARDASRQARWRADINTARMGLEQYATDHDGKYPTPRETARFNAGNYMPSAKPTVAFGPLAGFPLGRRLPLACTSPVVLVDTGTADGLYVVAIVEAVNGYPTVVARSDMGSPADQP